MKTKCMISIILMLFLGLCCVCDLSADTVSGSVSRNIGAKVRYRSQLEKSGIKDFSTDSLIELLDNELSTIRLNSVKLLGEMKDVSAISKLEEKLEDNSIHVRFAATRALLNMGNRKGIPALNEFCDKASAEVSAGKTKNLVYLGDALDILADAGEVSAIPHLRKLLKYSGPSGLSSRETALRGLSYAIRLKAVRSLEKLLPKDKTIDKDIESMLTDKHFKVCETAARILKKCCMTEISPESVIRIKEIERKSKIMRLEKELENPEFTDRHSAAIKLLRMDNRKGIPLMKEYADDKMAEIEAGEYKNVKYLSFALIALAEAGEVSTIPYLRKLLNYTGDSDIFIKTRAVQLLRKFYSKDNSVIKDIESMLKDEHPEVRQAAAEILEKIKSNQ